MFKGEGFWQGSDRNPEAIVHVESEPRIEGFAQHTFESSCDLLENHDPASGSDISLASFSDSCVDLTEVAGRHGIEIADQVSCAAGWNPLSSSGRHRFWHIHCTLTPKLIIYRFPVAVQQWLSIPNPSDLSLQPRFRSARDQLRLYLSGYALATHAKRYFLLDISMIPGSWTVVTLQALLDEPRGLLKHVVGSEMLNMSRGGISSNESCIMSCLRPLTQRTPFFPQQVWCEVLPNL